MQLNTHIHRGETTIAEIELRKPNAGELRGIPLVDLLQMEPNALIRVLPRITTPTITEAEAASMDPADLLSAGAVVAGFLLPAAASPAA